MIIMQCNISFSIIMNKTDLEWHQLQHAIGNWSKTQHAHTMPKKFDKDVTFYAECGEDSVNVAFHCRINKDSLTLEVIAIQE